MGSIFSIGNIIAGAALGFTAYNTYRSGRAAENAARAEAGSSLRQIEYIQEAAEIEAISDVESATALKEKTDLDFQTIDRREQEVISAVKSNEENFLKNQDLLEKQASILFIQKDREVAKSVGTARARAAGAGIVAGSGAAAQVSKDLQISGALEKARLRLQVADAQQKLDEDIAKSRSDAFIAAQNIAADREVLQFNYDVAVRQQDLSIAIRDIERDAKIAALESGAQVIQAGQTSPALGAFTVALQGLSRLSPP